MAEVPTPHLQLQKIRGLLRGEFTRAPEGKQITKIGFWEDTNGDIKYIKFYDGETLLLTLTSSKAGEATEETWNFTRS